MKKMITEIEKLDKQNKRCVILCREISRLSRNPDDNKTITELLFGKRGRRRAPVVASIYFLGQDLELQEWNNKSDRTAVEAELHKNYIESIETEKKSGQGKLLRLRAGECIVPAPTGLKRVLTNTDIEYKKHLHEKQETHLKEDENMPAIYRAFEMKAQ